jgi:GT2 family glycosyltransferase
MLVSRETGSHNRRTVLSIVIANSDGTEFTLNCLDSIYKYPPKVQFEIILVDNCSQNPIFPIVEHRYPQVHTLSAPERQGFSKNYNLGMRHATGELVMILNNDTFVHAGALDTLIRTIRQHDLYGVVGPKLLWPDGSIQTVCARELLTPALYAMTQCVLDLGTPTGKLWDRYQRSKLERRKSGPVPCISGACMLVKSEVLDKVGLLDEGYDFYYEDVEWCHRITKFGYHVGYVSEAEITHLGDRSLSKVKEWAKQSEYLSALRYFRQYHHLNCIQLWLLWLFTVVSYAIRVVAYWGYETLTGKRGHSQAYHRVLSWILANSPVREESVCI